jgi:hypothetical protein
MLATQFASAIIACMRTVAHHSVYYSYQRMNEKLHQSQLCSDNIVLFSLQYVSALIITHRQVLVKMHK